MKADVLVLDARYYPLGRITWMRAITLVIEEQVDLVEEYKGKEIHSAKQVWPRPAVIRWKKNVGRRWRGVRYSKEMVFARDKGKCCYCGLQITMKESTRDHVIPKSKGGKTSFTNIVLSCKPCNTKKSDMTPEEAGMRLKVSPTKPDKGTPYYAILGKRTKIPKEWRNWIVYADWIAEFCESDAAGVEVAGTHLAT